MPSASNFQSMTDRDNLTSLRGLHQDLLALESSQLLNVERLWVDLESRINDFKNLLAKSPKKERSRNEILSGTNELKRTQPTVYMACMLIDARF